MMVLMMTIGRSTVDRVLAITNQLALLLLLMMQRRLQMIVGCHRFDSSLVCHISSDIIVQLLVRSILSFQSLVNDVKFCSNIAIICRVG